LNEKARASVTIGEIAPPEQLLQGRPRLLYRAINILVGSCPSYVQLQCRHHIQPVALLDAGVAQLGQHGNPAFAAGGIAVGQRSAECHSQDDQGQILAAPLRNLHRFGEVGHRGVVGH
jgi:hypothetical protein